MKTIIIVFGILLILSIFLASNSFTGFTLTSTPSRQASIIFSQENLTYNSSLITIDGGIIKLKETTVKIDNEIVENTQYSILAALYDSSSDKTEKIVEVDDKSVEMSENKPIKMIFFGDLSNGDVFSVYIKSGKSSTLKLCDFKTNCDKQYGSTEYIKNNEGLYNITISGLESATKFFTLISTDNIDLDQIKSDKQTASRIIIDPDDKKSKISQQDDEKQSVGKEKFFYFITDSNVKDGSTVKLYLDGGSDSIVRLCSLPSCSEVYGSINYKKNEKGFYNTTLSVPSSTDKFLVDTDKSTDINYININYTKASVETTYNTTYPSVASIETQEIYVKNLKKWELFYANKSSAQNVKIFYSTDNLMWNILPDSGFLGDANNSDKMIKFRINITSDSYSTPEISGFKLFYIELLPYFESQTIVKPSASSGSIVDIKFNAMNTELIDYVNAQIINYTGFVLKNIELKYNDMSGFFEGQWNTSGSIEGVYTVNLSISSGYTETKNIKDMIALLSNIRGSFSSVPVKQGEFVKFDAKENASAEIEIKGQTNSSLNMISYSKNIKQSFPKETEAGKYLEIISKENVTNFDSAKIRLYYTDEEIASAGLDESTLSIQYYNETSGIWEKLPSVVNITGKYTEASIQHFSTYGLFGDLKTSQTSSNSVSDKGGVAVYPPEKKLNLTESVIEKSKSADVQTSQNPLTPNIAKNIEGNHQCSKEIDLIVENKIDATKDSLAGKIINLGACDVENLKITVNGELYGLIYANPDTIKSLPKNSASNFTLNMISQSHVVLLNPIQGLVVASGKGSNKFSNGVVKVEGNFVGGNSMSKEMAISISTEKDPVKETPFIPVLSVLAALVILIIIRRKSGSD